METHVGEYVTGGEGQSYKEQSTDATLAQFDAWSDHGRTEQQRSGSPTNVHALSTASIHW